MEKVQMKCAVCNIANHGCKPNNVKAWLCYECVNFMIDTENSIAREQGKSILDVVRDDLVENTKDLIENTEDHNDEKGTDVGTIGDTRGNMEGGEVTDVNAGRNEDLNENEAEATDEYNSREDEGDELDILEDDGNDDEDGLADISRTTSDEDQLKQIYENIL